MKATDILTPQKQNHLHGNTKKFSIIVYSAQHDFKKCNTLILISIITKERLYIIKIGYASRTKSDFKAKEF